MSIKHPEKPVFEYSKITDHIYIGTNQCCQPHFNRSLLRRGIRADISLEKIRLDSPFGVDYYLWLPTEDHKAPNLKQLLVGANFLKQLVDNGVKCYVHCEHGHGRAPILVAAYLILEGMDAEEGLALVKKQRPAIHPNKTQRRALLDFQKRARR